MRTRCLAFLLITGTCLAADDQPASAVDFGQVQAIFAAKCLACHGSDPKEIKGGYDLRTREAAIKGGESGDVAIVAGEPLKSPLYRAVTWDDESLQMPPKENDRLTKEQVAVIRNWIAAGAKWDTTAATKPDQKWAGQSGGIRIATSGGRSADWENRTYEPEA